MSWVAVAVGGSALIGAGASYMGSQAQAKGVKAAGDASAQAAAMQDATTREMFYRGLQENQPYKNVGLRGLAELQSALLGGKVNYNDPSYMQLSDEEAARYRAEQVWKKAQAGEMPLFDDFWKDVNRGADPIERLMRDPSTLAAGNGGKMPMLYRAPDGSITDKPPTLTAEYDYKASPSLIPQTRAYNRALASRGLSGSGQAATGVADLAAGDYDKQISRLSGLAGMGQSAANANAGAATATGAGLSNIYGQQGQNKANILMQGGENKASLYGGLGGLATNAANTYLMSKYLNGQGAGTAPTYPNTGNWFTG